MKIKLTLAAACSVIIATSPLFAEGHPGGGGAKRPGGFSHPSSGPNHNAAQQAKEKFAEHHDYTKDDSRQLQQRNAGGDGSGPNWLDKDPGVNERQENQRDRIQQGVKSGQLTQDETQGLRSTEQEIRQEEGQYKSDGTLTKDERVDLHKDLNSASKEIYQEKHDAETQPGVTPAQPGKPGIHDPRVNGRQDNQKDRIQQGVKSGSLTKGETKELVSDQKEIRQEEKEYKSDGTLTKDERVDLHKDQNAASKEIYQEKHDEEVRLTPDPKKLGTKDPTINQHQENQKDRIQQGVKSGELTRREALTLKEKEFRAARVEKRLKEDGSLTPEERARLQKYQDYLSKDIYKQKHDGQEQK